ncbi:MAG: AMP-binding protein [Rubricoccaceae bacterium]
MPAVPAFLADPLLADPLRAAPPEAPALVRTAGVLSYGALDRRVAAAAEALRREGVGPGETAALWAPHAAADPEATLVAVLALWRLGAVAAPLSTRLPEATARAQAERLGAPLLDAAALADVAARSGGGALGEDPAAPPGWSLGARATVVFTSGTSGEPKAAVHTLGNHVASAHGWITRLGLGPAGLGPGVRWLLDLPLFHVGGLAVAVRALLSGAAVVLPERGMPPSEAARALGATHASLVAAQLRRALDDADDALGRMRLLLLGASAIPPEALHAARARGWPVVPSYGLTEMSSTVTAVPLGAPPEALETAGTPLPGRTLRLAPDGEVLVGGPARFAGYWTPAGLETPFDAEGLFATGDLGAWTDVAGTPMLRLIGRKDNLFISGGENVQPEAVEAALRALPGVREAVVVPVPDPAFGQRPVAFVDAAPFAPAAWREALAGRLARFQIPDAFHPWPLEAAEGLKPGRAALRARAEALAARAGD